MLKTLQAFLEKYAPAQTSDSGERVRIAAAALLMEVTRMDEDVAQNERAIVLDAIKAKFDLSEEAAHELVGLGLREAKGATDYFEFTREINRSFSPEQKVKLIEQLWRVAYADNTLHKYEDHLVRKLADLLYVPHADVIAAKLKARDAC